MARIRSSKNWFQRVRRKFVTTSQKDIFVLHSNACTSPSESRSSEARAQEFLTCSQLPGESVTEYEDRFVRLGRFASRTLTVEDVAAMKIQAIFRGHLARRAFRALRSLVRLQALARGAYVRKQSRLALHCMQALVRLQVRIKARQLLGKCSDDY